MRFRTGMLMAAVLVLAACQGERATVTGQYGTAMMTGQVVMADGSSPAGVSVTLRGSGITTVLRTDGQFAFAGTPEAGDLSFERAADGISALLRVEPGSGPMVVELSKSGASTKSSKRRSGRGGSGVKVTQFEGVISSVSPTGIVLFTSKQVDQAIAFDAATSIRKGKTALTPADLAAGMRVHVKAKQVDTAYVATLVMVQNDGSGDDGGDDGAHAEVKVSGRVATVAGTALTVETGRGTVTVQTDAATRIERRRSAIVLTELAAGEKVKVEGTRVDATTILATKIEAK